MYILCNKTTKRIEGFKKWDRFTFDATTHVELVVSVAPNMDLDRLNSTNDGVIKATRLKINAAKASRQARIDRDRALNNLTHDFGDGRIMQIRAKDESNIRNAIEIMNANSITSIDWVMSDNIKQPVDIADLQAALQSGQLAVMQIWNDYTP